MARKKGSIEPLQAYRTTDGKVYHGSGAKKAAQQHQTFLNVQARAERLSMQMLDFFGTGLFKLSNGPDSNETLKVEEEVRNFFGNIPTFDDSLSEEETTAETFTTLAHIFIEFEQQFPGVLMKIAELIQSEFSKRGIPRIKK